MSETVEESSKLGDFFTNQYTILENVFSNLNTHELVALRAVCTDWRGIADITIRNRRRIQCVCHGYAGPGATPDYIASLAEAEIHFYNKFTCRKDCVNILRSEKTLYCFSDHGVIYRGVNDSFRWLRYRPFRPVTPKSEIHFSVRFPQWDGVTVKLFSHNCETAIYENEMDSRMRMLRGIKIEAVVIRERLSFNECEGAIRRTQHNIKMAIRSLHKLSGEFAIAGIRSELRDNDVKAREDRMQILIFAGPNVVAASTVLDEQCRTQAGVSSQVENFSQSFTSTNNGVLLIFRCCGREKVQKRNNYKPGNSILHWESQAVAKWFPQIPCVGCYGVGEYGLDYPKSDDADVKKVRFEFNERHIFTSYSTILMYIGYK